MLAAVGDAVLPLSELGPEGIARVVADFRSWLDGYAPAAELSHNYLTTDWAVINYGPPHPSPRWASQLEALELVAQRRHGVSFLELAVEERRALIRRRIRGDSLDRLPHATEARHIAVALVAYFYATSEANDLCHRAAVGANTPRSLEQAGERPAPLERGV
jgi:hypothetical protein